MSAIAAADFFCSSVRFLFSSSEVFTSPEAVLLGIILSINPLLYVENDKPLDWLLEPLFWAPTDTWVA